ncbi:MGDG synthase family glycosyltransferase [Alkalibacillus haloalkaliphilus]|uniref:MGDG synthase family glycosyltransferase n=1 Tax=Alkalibacillus haloalkaliphilus TaxID=94136 RepID=UPI0029355F5D|nr:glycosyltransferase [Alkalibacillus haloalkaliphilus]MDV2582947.1 glycosyltransferase [Alkalibacillus haloalkaliphilus]
MQKKILILSEPFGLGHTKVAEGIAQRISMYDSSIDIKIIELGSVLKPFVTSVFVHSYQKLSTQLPSLWRRLYHFQQHQPVSTSLQSFIYQLFHRKIEDLLEQYNPDLVICTHPFCSSTVARKKRLGFDVKQCTIVTDCFAHGIWVQPEVDLYFVPTQYVKNQIVNMGIPSERINVTGIPVDPKFSSNENKYQVRKGLNLNEELPTVLIMGGGLGLGGIPEIAKTLSKWKEKLQIIVCTGKNNKLKDSLLNNKDLLHSNINILGYTDDVDQWMGAADLLITKPGGSTCFEAIFKGVPLLIYQPLFGHEEENCQFFVNHGLAIKLSDDEMIEDYVYKLLYDPKDINAIRDRISQFQQKLDPQRSVKSIVDLINQ